MLQGCILVRISRPPPLGRGNLLVHDVIHQRLEDGGGQGHLLAVHADGLAGLEAQLEVAPPRQSIAQLTFMCHASTIECIASAFMERGKQGLLRPKQTSLARQPAPTEQPNSGQSLVDLTL